MNYVFSDIITVRTDKLMWDSVIQLDLLLSALKGLLAKMSLPRE